MKRMVAVILAVMMVVMAGCVAQADALKDAAEEIRTMAKECLGQLIIIYEKDPDRFDADYISWFHGYLKLYEGSVFLNGALSRCELREQLAPCPAIYDDTARDIERSNGEMYRILDEEYEKWLNQEITDKEYCEKIIRVVKAMLKA